jgi:hypothetical protein
MKKNILIVLCFLLPVLSFSQTEFEDNKDNELILLKRKANQLEEQKITLELELIKRQLEITNRQLDIIHKEIIKIEEEE